MPAPRPLFRRVLLVLAGFALGLVLLTLLDIDPRIPFYPPSHPHHHHQAYYPLLTPPRPDKLSTSWPPSAWLSARLANPPTLIPELLSAPAAQRPPALVAEHTAPDGWAPSERVVLPPLREWKDRAPIRGKLGKEAGGQVPRVQWEGFAAVGWESEEERREREERQRGVRNAFLWSWEGYKANAWGFDEVKPVTSQPSSQFARSSPFGGYGATIIDNLDTLLIMGLDEEFEQCRDHVRQVDFTYVHSQSGTLPVFETNIRYLGGLLSAYDLSGDELMLQRAIDLGDMLLRTFDTDTGIPVAQYRPGSYPSNPGSVVLAEAGSMALEFFRLYQLTGNQTFFDVAQRTEEYLFGLESTLGSLLPTHVALKSKKPVGGTYTVGALADSYYEYLIKIHRLLDFRLPIYGEKFSLAADDIFTHLLTLVPASSVGVPDLLILGEQAAQRASPAPLPRLRAKLEHLSCFAGGTFALGSRLLGREDDLEIAAGLAQACFDVANSTKTGLAPEVVEFDVAAYADARDRPVRVVPEPPAEPWKVKDFVGRHIGRPEIVESLFYMWRVTGERRWQDMGWRMFTSWARLTRSNAGFTSIHDVRHFPVLAQDNQESFVLAETLKYFYLLFSDPNHISIDDWVLSTEAHPFKLSHTPPPRPNAVWPSLAGPVGEGTPQQRWFQWREHEHFRKGGTSKRPPSGGAGTGAGAGTGVRRVGIGALREGRPPKKDGED